VREKMGRGFAAAVLFLGVFAGVMAMGRAAARPAGPAQDVASQVFCRRYRYRRRGRQLEWPRGGRLGDRRNQ